MYKVQWRWDDQWLGRTITRTNDSEHATLEYAIALITDRLFSRDRWVRNTIRRLKWRLYSPAGTVLMANDKPSTWAP